MSLPASSIPKDQWRWFGSAGHYCQAGQCRWHLLTRIGDLMVSSVGERVVDSLTRDIKEIGSGRKYETMVFHVDDECDCGCGRPLNNGRALFSRGCNDAAEAERNHHETCNRVAAGEISDYQKEAM